MKLYDQDQMTGYSLTHPRGRKKSFMASYYFMTRNRKVSYIHMHTKTMCESHVPSIGGRIKVYITYHTNAITLVKRNGIQFKKVFLKDDYYNLKDRNHITIETNLYGPTYYSNGLDLGISYHLNGKGRLWCIERELEVKL